MSAAIGHLADWLRIKIAGVLPSNHSPDTSAAPHSDQRDAAMSEGANPLRLGGGFPLPEPERSLTELVRLRLDVVPMSVVDVAWWVEM